MSRLIDQFTVGSVQVAALSDGAPDRALGNFFHGVETALWTRALGITDPAQPVPFNFGTFLLRSGGRTVLIDTGYGAPALTMGIPGGGELITRLAEAGVRPEQVDDVIITHLHADHCGWNITPGEGGAPGRLTFPNATIHVAAREIEYWFDSALDAEDRARPARLNTLPARAAGQLATFDGETELVPGVTTVPTPGHTPGHTSIMVVSQGQHLLIVGDAAHHPIHFEHHDWIPAVDVDPAESTRSRGKLSALAVERDAIVTGGHFPILTLGRLRRVEGGYRWEGFQP